MVRSHSAQQSLEGKVALVTGAGSGIGRASALALASQGAHVIVTDRDPKACRAVDAEIRGSGGQSASRTLDVTDDKALEGVIESSVRRFGRLDVLHSHAGLQVEGKLEEVAVSDMDASWRLNVRSHFVASKFAIPFMRQQGGGSIIITASNSGIQIDRGMIAYATTKHAAVAMTRQMAADYAKDNIRFNALCPGFVDTPFNAGFELQMGGRAALERYVSETIPMGRFGAADEIADAVVFLASDLSAFMTGHALVIDGGESI